MKEDIKINVECIQTLGSGIVWRLFDINDSDTFPKECGKYLVRRKDGKIHFEKYNGTGWAYNNNNITNWSIINQPLNT